MFTEGELSLNQFAWAQQLTENALEQLLETFELVNVAGIILSKNNADNAKQKLLNTLEEYHQQHNDQMGVGRSRLKRMALPTYHDELVYHLIEQLRKEGAISQSRGWLHLPTHGLAFRQNKSLYGNMLKSILNNLSLGGYVILQTK